MKIAHVVETLERGGLERMVCDLVAMQAARGDEPVVICLFHAGVLAAELTAAGVPVAAVGKRSGADLGALWRLRGQLRRQRADVVHTHNAVAHYHAVSAGWAGNFPPIVNTRHGMGEARDSRVERRYRRSLGRTARVVAVSNYSGAHFVQQGTVPEPLLRVIPNGIRVERFAQQSRAAARVRLGVAPDALLVGTVGRLNWAKDQAVLIAAIAALAPRFPTLECLLIGDGTLRSELETQIASLGLGQRVRLLGDRGDVPDLLPAFDVFALPSKTEGYSIALLETAAAGVPAVVTDVGGNREIVQPGVTGVVAAGDFAAALEAVLADADTRQRLGASAREWAVAHASVQVMADRYAELYRSVA